MSLGSRIGRQPNAVKHMCAIEIERIKSKMSSSSAQTPPPPPPPHPPPSSSTNPANPVAAYYEHHQQLRSIQQQANTSLYNQSIKIEEGEILFPPWTSAAYHPAYYEAPGGHVGLPEITAIKSGGSSSDQQQQQRFAKLAELAGESEVDSGYAAAAAAAVAAAAMDSSAYESRVGSYTGVAEINPPRMRAGSDTSSLAREGSILPSIQGVAAQQQQQQIVTTSASSITTLPPNPTHLYDSSAAGAGICSYEQAAVSLPFFAQQNVFLMHFESSCFFSFSSYQASYAWLKEFNQSIILTVVIAVIAGATRVYRCRHRHLLVLVC